DPRRAGVTERSLRQSFCSLRCHVQQRLSYCFQKGCRPPAISPHPHPLRTLPLCFEDFARFDALPPLKSTLISNLLKTLRKNRGEGSPASSPAGVQRGPLLPCLIPNRAQRSLVSVPSIGQFNFCLRHELLRHSDAAEIVLCLQHGRRHIARDRIA